MFSERHPQRWCLGILLATVFLAGSSLLAQSTIVVDASNGPGTSFTDFPPAYAAARAGDTIVFRSGTYSTPATPVAKPLQILGEPKARLCFLGAFQIAGIPGGTSLTLGNFVLGCPGGTFDVEVADCAGGVHVEHLRATRLTVKRSQLVTFADSVVGQLLVEDAIVNVTTSLVHPSGFAGTSGPNYALDALRSRVTLSRSTVVGDSGSWTIAPPTACQILRTPFVGARLVNSTVIVSRNGWLGGGVLSTRPTCNTVLTADAAVGSGSRIEHDPAGWVGTVSGGITVVTQPRDWMSYCYGVGASPGGSLQAVLGAETGSTYVVLASLPIASILTPFNELWIDPNPANDVVFGMGVTTALAVTLILIPVPAFLPPGLPISVQAGLWKSGQLSFSSAATVLLHTSDAW